jgi:myo-inositol 2-dehydrogenase/D-chiro-inositol 1-dehydrogenase
MNAPSTLPVRFGLIGYGAWGSHHARAIAGCARAQLVAVAARSEETQGLARAAHPDAQVFADYRELLAREDIEVVDVVLPSDLHHEVGLAVLAAGKHLLLEKPMALTEAQCDDLIRAAAERRLLVAIGHELRLSSLWGRVKELIEAGAIGEPQYALIELWRNPYRLGAGGWRYDIARVGNWILEEPIHFFDLARWYFSGAGEPRSVFARAKARRAEHPELQDNFSAILDFEGGAYAVISQTLGGFEHHQVAKLTGSRGALWASWSGAMDRTLHPTFSLKHSDGTAVHEVPIDAPSGEVFELRDEIEAMAAAVRDGAPLPATGHDGRWSVAMCLRAAESVASGQPVRF